MPGKFLGIVGQDPSDSKSNRLHVLVLLYSFEVYSIDPSKMIDNSPRSLKLQPIVSQIQLVHL